MKKKSVGQLLKRAKPLFRLYIRHRDTDKYGWGFCVTCGVRVHFKYANAGHFRHKNNATYFLEDNCHLQCVPCNFGGLGEGHRYGLFIDKKYGKGRAEELRRLSFTTRIYKREELEAMIAYWNAYIEAHPKG